MIKSIIRKLLKLRKNIIRKYYTFRCKNVVANYAGIPTVNGRSAFTHNVYLGMNTHFNGMLINGNARVEIGDNFHSGINCQIITDVHNYEGTALPYDDTYIQKEVKIKNNVWIGNNVIILGGVEIGEGVIIQAGSVVTKSLPDLVIAGGHPANIFSSRNRDHYYTLKGRNAFH